MNSLGESGNTHRYNRSRAFPQSVAEHAVRKLTRRRAGDARTAKIEHKIMPLHFTVVDESGDDQNGELECVVQRDDPRMCSRKVSDGKRVQCAQGEAGLV